MSLTDILLPLLVMLVVSTVIESLLIPRPIAIWRRDWQAVVLFVLTLCCLFGLYLAITRRPWLSAALTAGLPALLTGVSNVKFNQLREPLLYTDWRYFWEMIRYPALYLPYFGTWLAGGLLLLFVAALGVWLSIEAPALGWLDGVLLGAVLIILSGGLSVLVLRRWPTAQRLLNPLKDLQDWGGLAMHRVYRMRLNQPAVVAPGPFLHLNKSDSVLPDIICIQAESFVDRRRWDLDLKEAPKPALTNWDRLCDQSMMCGRLIVPSWGANTVRTEFAVLTGIDPERLSVHQFDPYRSLLMPSRLQGLVGLPAWLAGHGYRNAFVHPYERTFYDRHQVMPRLGFETFVDLTAFRKEDYVGRYVGDAAVGSVIQEQIHPAHPSFVYAVTMQGHGPYGEGHESPDQWVKRYDQCIQSLDQMIGSLREALIARKRPAVLCVFGDHVPSMPSVYAQVGMPKRHTDFVIWQTGLDVPAGDHAQRCDLSADRLAVEMLRAAGFRS